MAIPEPVSNRNAMSRLLSFAGRSEKTAIQSPLREAPRPAGTMSRPARRCHERRRNEGANCYQYRKVGARSEIGITGMDAVDLRRNCHESYSYVCVRLTPSHSCQAVAIAVRMSIRAARRAGSSAAPTPASTAIAVTVARDPVGMVSRLMPCVARA
jgi:hypothetical protein